MSAHVVKSAQYPVFSSRNHVLHFAQLSREVSAGYGHLIGSAHGLPSSTEDAHLFQGGHRVVGSVAYSHANLPYSVDVIRRLD